MSPSPTTISSVFSWESLDSRGNPTVACEVTLQSGARGITAVPSGASTGTYEARELRDGGERYGGLGVLSAVSNVNGPIAEGIVGLDAGDQEQLDEVLRVTDGTADLRSLGANAVLAVSIASAIASSAAHGKPLYRDVLREGERPLLPMPMVNIISGGAHAARALDVQDLLVVPVCARTFSEAIEVAWRVRKGTGEALTARGLATGLVADEGGYGPSLATNRAALDLLVEGIERGGLAPGDDVGIAIDVAASQFFDPDTSRYRLSIEDRDLTASELVDEIASWCATYPVISVEDVLADQDLASWPEAAERLGDVQLVGDDLFVTDSRRLAEGIAAGIANAILVKPNQTGTLSGARAVVDQARAARFATILSARSGETEDSWLADLAVGWRAGQIKVGSTMRSERTAKWNRLLHIEAELGGEAQFAGRASLAK